MEAATLGRLLQALFWVAVMKRSRFSRGGRRQTDALTRREKKPPPVPCQTLLRTRIVLVGASHPGFGSHYWVGLQAPSILIGSLRVLHRFFKSIVHSRTPQRLSSSTLPCRWMRSKGPPENVSGKKRPQSSHVAACADESSAAHILVKFIHRE